MNWDKSIPTNRDYVLIVTMRWEEIAKGEYRKRKETNKKHTERPRENL